MTAPTQGPEAPAPTARHRKPLAQRLRRWGLEVLLVIAIIAGVHWYQTRTLAIGLAPELRAETILGSESIDLTGPAQGPQLIYFWATWCPICRLEQSTISALTQDYSVITVAMQSGTASEVRAYLTEQALDWKTIADTSGEIATDWGVQAVPASFILDSEGRIRSRTVGYTTGWGLRARLWLARFGGSQRNAGDLRATSD